ncbi:MAG: hypothetical protein KGH74_05630, partial [Candidatus Micrarchaeota archaeon]|nr:hypothetical protein [Candidatus Micrarchaeota archaeon]
NNTIADTINIGSALDTLTFGGTATFNNSLTANTFASSGVTITGGTVNNTTIGITTPAAGNFTTIGATTAGTGAFTTLTASTSATSPLVYGGTGVSSTLTLDGTSNGSPANAYVLLNPSGQGNVGVGTGTPGSSLQVNGNVAIGYSSSTGAPAKGLAVSGPITMGTANSSTDVTIGPATTANGGDTDYGIFVEPTISGAVNTPVNAYYGVFSDPVFNLSGGTSNTISTVYENYVSAITLEEP